MTDNHRIAGVCKTCLGSGIEYDGAGHTCMACNGLGGSPAVERQGRAPEITISQCQFFGLNEDGLDPFGFQGAGIKTLTHFRMIGWRCYGPSIQAELSDDQILEAMREHVYAADGGYVFETAKPALIAAGRALIAAALNDNPSIEVTP